MWVFEKKMLRKIKGGSNMTGTNCDLFTHKSSWSYLNHLVYGPKRDEVIGEWKRVHKEKLYDLNSLPYIIRMISHVECDGRKM
jgi:hypothetical protein